LLSVSVGYNDRQPCGKPFVSVSLAFGSVIHSENQGSQFFDFFLCFSHRVFVIFTEIFYKLKIAYHWLLYTPVGH